MFNFREGSVQGRKYNDAPIKKLIKHYENRCTFCRVDTSIFKQYHSTITIFNFVFCLIWVNNSGPSLLRI